MDPEMEKRLRGQGYSDSDIANAKRWYEKQAQAEPVGPPSPKRPSQNVPQSPWELLKHLFSTGSLY